MEVLRVGTTPGALSVGTEVAKNRPLPKLNQHCTHFQGPIQEAHEFLCTPFKFFRTPLHPILNLLRTLARIH